MYLSKRVFLACAALVASSGMAQVKPPGKDATVQEAARAVMRQYRIPGLNPGTYTLTFRLEGFNVVRREGIELTGTTTLTIPIDLRVGALQETVTVTGETPVVDVHTAARTQKVIDNEVVSVLPASRGYGNILATVPGIQATGLNSGANPVMNFFTARGGRGN